MSTSSSGSNSGDSGASFGGLRLVFCSTSSEPLHVEIEREIHEDPASEHAESSWPKREGYEWVHKGVRNCFSKYRWSRLLRSWLASVYLFERGADINAVSIERVSGIDSVCHGREGFEDDFFYVYACMFMKLHVRLPFDEFTMGVLRRLNVAPTQLHLNSWGSLQAFKLICKALYLVPTPESFLYFYTTRSRDPISWLSLISRPKVGLLDGFTQSFKKFKDGFFRVRLLNGGRALYYDECGSPRFPFYWTEMPARLDALSKDMLYVESRRVADILERLPTKVLGKWVVCCYLTDNPARDLCGKLVLLSVCSYWTNLKIVFCVGVMAHHARKVGGEVDLFAKIRDKLENAAKAEGQSQAPNLVGPVVDTYAPAATKRPAPSKLKGVGKDRKRLRALAKTGGVGSSGSSNPDLGGFEKNKVQMRKGVEIKLSDEEVGVVEAADPGLVMRALSEYLAR